MSDKKSIKETIEMLEGMETVMLAVKKIAADKKVGAEDLAHLIGLAKDIDVLSTAVEGAGEIPSELKDLDEMEVVTVISKIYSISKALKDA